MRYSELKYYHFLDSEEQEMGTLEDLVLDTDTLEPSHLLLGAGFFAEFLEHKGDLEDIDELAPLDLVKEIDADYIILSESLSNLQTTSKEGKLPISGNKFSTLCKLPVFLQDNQIDAELFDIEINGKDSKLYFSYIELSKELGSHHYGQRFDICVRVDKVQINQETIRLPLSFDELRQYVIEEVEPKPRGRTTIDWISNP